MLFKKLVEQHRVYLIVAHGVDRPFSSWATRSGLTIYIGWVRLLRAELDHILLVAEGDWFKRKERYTGFVIGLILLERFEDVEVLAGVRGNEQQPLGMVWR